MAAEVTASIIVPSFNRPRVLQACLDALLKLDDDAYEIIVVDDGSTAPLSEACRDYADRVRFIRKENGGPASARNVGVRETRADFLVFTDDDCQPEPGWLQAMRACAEGQPHVLAGGRVVNLLTDNTFSSASQSLCDFLYDYFGAASGNMPFFTSNNMACSRRVFEQIGGFDETFPLAAAEDREFGLRWRAAGGALVYAPEAVVGHAHRLDLRGFMRQHANYGRGARRLHAVLGERGDPRPTLESVRFYLRLITFPLRAQGRNRWAQSALLVLSQIAMVAGYFSYDPQAKPSAREPLQTQGARS